MSRVLLLSTTTGYQTHEFREAAERSGIDLALATDRCHMLEDPWRDGAVAVRFHAAEPSVQAIVEAAAERPFVGLLALGDRPTVIAALAAAALGLPGHPPEAARTASNKWSTRERLEAAGLPTPWFRSAPLDVDAATLVPSLSFPCVVKPLAMAGSRGVIRADGPEAFVAVVERVRRLLSRTDVRALRDPALDRMVIEGFVPGLEFAVEGLLDHGVLHVLAVFDKPDPLDGPFFEETIYVTPSRAAPATETAIVRAVEAAVGALGLRHGPIHAEVRCHEDGVYVLEVAPRPIGGLCARALRFIMPERGLVPLEELLLRHAAGQHVVGVQREPSAAGVMMVPIPATGYYRRVEKLDEARAVPDVEEIRITAKPDQLMEQLPEGSSYLGFIFARAGTAAEVERALREAHACLRFVFDAALPVV